MNARNLGFIVVTSILIISLLTCAGCTSIPGPDVRLTPSLTKTPVPSTPAIKITPVKTTISPAPIHTSTPPPALVTTAGTGQGTYETRACVPQGGTVVRPGETCPGTWLDATDSFSCCSQAPVSAVDLNASITIAPFDLKIDMDDDPGSILP